MISWSYFKKFKKINDRWLPPVGDGDTKATQIVTAVNRLIYNWYNDGDVYDNTCFLSGWLNDLSSYANWLLKYADCTELLMIKQACSVDDYEKILKDLADKTLDESYLAEMDKQPKIGDIYECDGIFKFIQPCNEEEY